MDNGLGVLSALRTADLGLASEIGT